MSKKKKTQKSEWKNALLDGLGELLVYFLAFAIGFGIILLLPNDIGRNLDPEFVGFIGIIVLITAVVLIAVPIHIFLKNRKMKEFKFIYNSLKNKYDLTLLTTTKDDTEIPTIRGKAQNGRFELYKIYKNKSCFVFSAEYSDTCEENKYEKIHLQTGDDAKKQIEIFMKQNDI